MRSGLACATSLLRTVALALALPCALPCALVCGWPGDADPRGRAAAEPMAGSAPAGGDRAHGPAGQPGAPGGFPRGGCWW
jgi:hypothetical protein